MRSWFSTKRADARQGEDPSLAFPFREQARARAALRVLPSSSIESLGYVPFADENRYSPPRLEGARLLIPYRIYNPPLPRGTVTQDALPFVSAIYTRHHDGHVRQAALADALRCWQPWMAPFVVQLLGEYVVEIAVDVCTWWDTADDLARNDLGRFASSNPEFIAISRARATSYWNEYYRGDFPLRSYPSLMALKKITGTWR